jgi:hypothetical protein
MEKSLEIYMGRNDAQHPELLVACENGKLFYWKAARTPKPVKTGKVPAFLALRKHVKMKGVIQSPFCRISVEFRKGDFQAWVYAFAKVFVLHSKEMDYASAATATLEDQRLKVVSVDYAPVGEFSMHPKPTKRDILVSKSTQDLIEMCEVLTSDTIGKKLRKTLDSIRILHTMAEKSFVPFPKKLHRDLKHVAASMILSQSHGNSNLFDKALNDHSRILSLLKKVKTHLPAHLQET